jgi:hypothetical protein
VAFGMFLQAELLFSQTFQWERLLTDWASVTAFTYLWQLQISQIHHTYRGADKSLAWPGRKQAKLTEDFEFHISYL